MNPVFLNLDIDLKMEQNRKQKEINDQPKLNRPNLKFLIPLQWFGSISYIYIYIYIILICSGILDLIC